MNSVSLSLTFDKTFIVFLSSSVVALYLLLNLEHQTFKGLQYYEHMMHLVHMQLVLMQLVHMHPPTWGAGFLSFAVFKFSSLKVLEVLSFQIFEFSVFEVFSFSFLDFWVFILFWVFSLSFRFFEFLRFWVFKFLCF